MIVNEILHFLPITMSRKSENLRVYKTLGEKVLGVRGLWNRRMLEPFQTDEV